MSSAFDPVPIGKAADVHGTRAITFTFRDEHGILSDGFLIRYNGELRAFRNQCRHQPLSLDYGDGDFFTEQGDLLLCRNHGALFEPDSGKCVAGPCAGACLHRLDITEKNGDVFLTGFGEGTGDLE